MYPGRTLRTPGRPLAVATPGPSRPGIATGRQWEPARIPLVAQVQLVLATSNATPCTTSGYRCGLGLHKFPANICTLSAVLALGSSRKSSTPSWTDPLPPAAQALRLQNEFTHLPATQRPRKTDRPTRPAGQGARRQPLGWSPLTQWSIHALHMAELSAVDRRALRMVEIDGASYAEVAEALQLERDHVKPMVFAARCRIFDKIRQTMRALEFVAPLSAG